MVFLLLLFIGFVVLPDLLILASESLNSPPGVHNLLLPSKQGVTLRTYLDSNLLGGGKGFKFVATGTMNDCLLKGWMNIFFHDAYLHLLKRYTVASERFM